MTDTAPPADDWYGPDAATFGDRVAAAREAAGMSQADLAGRIGVKVSTLKSWEDDLSEPRANRLSMMAGMLSVSMMWLMNGAGQGLDAPSDTAELPSDAAAMLLEMRELNTTLKQSAERLARLEKRLRAMVRDGTA